MSADKVRDALAYLLWQIDTGKPEPTKPPPVACFEDADIILASDVLATIKADAQREVVDAVEAVVGEILLDGGMLLAPGEMVRNACVAKLRAALAPYRAEGYA